MAIIKNVEEFTKTNGKKSWKFTMDDGVVGYISNDKPWEYKTGESVSYTIADKGTYKVLTFTRLPASTPTQGAVAPTPVFTPVPQSQLPKPFPHVGGGVSALDIFNAKLEMNKSIFEAVLQQLADGKFDDARASEKLEFYRNYFENVIDVLAKGK